MADLPELSQFDSVYQIETTDLVQGGESGTTNIPLKALTNRTKWLKDRVDRGLRTNGTLAYTYTVDKTLEVEHIGKHLQIQHTGALGNTLTIPTAGVADGQLLSLEGVGTNLMNIGGVAGVTTFLPGMQIVIRFNGASWEIFQTNDVGSVIAYARNTAPIGYLKCNGAAVSRTTYARLFAIIGTTFGAGNGSTTFNLPDLRGEFIRGWDDGRGIDSGRAFGSAQAQDIQSHNHLFSGNNRVGISSSSYGSNATLAANMLAGSPTTSPTSDNTGGTETRPRNVALLYCIKF